MPPKGSVKKDKKEKKKPLAAEYERLAEEVRKAIEAEGELVRQEKNLAASMQARHQEETDRLEEGAQAALGEEREEDAPFLQERRGKIADLLSEVAKEQEWVTYLECNPLPEPESEASLNTFLSIAREADKVDYLNEPHLKMPALLYACETTEQVTHTHTHTHAHTHTHTHTHTGDRPAAGGARQGTAEWG
jgi:ABC-type nickel/cobalt efflux system permease component RcnA